MSTKLDEEVRAALIARRGDWQRIVAELDGKPSYSWLSKFANGHIDNPGYAQLMRLHDHLLPKPRRASRKPACTA